MAIIDANVVTFMVAFILFILATAGIKGFAFTLGVGTLVSFFTAVLLTPAVLGTLGRSRIISHPNALGANRKRDLWGGFDFMGKSKWFFSLSGVILLIGALAIGGKGLNFGIDFKSGTRVKTELIKPTNENGVRSVLSGVGFADAEVQRLSGKEIKGNSVLGHSLGSAGCRQENPQERRDRPHPDRRRALRSDRVFEDALAARLLPNAVRTNRPIALRRAHRDVGRADRR